MIARTLARAALFATFAVVPLSAAESARATENPTLTAAASGAGQIAVQVSGCGWWEGFGHGPDSVEIYLWDYDGKGGIIYEGTWTAGEYGRAGYWCPGALSGSFGLPCTDSGHQGGYVYAYDTTSGQYLFSKPIGTLPVCSGN